MDFAESTVFAVTQDTKSRDWAALSTVIDSEFLRIQKLSEHRQEVTGIATGYVDLDRQLAGLQPTDLVVLAARPSMGKTALAVNIAQNVALAGSGVGIFSLEMSREQLATRMLCAQARVNATNVRTGRLTRERDMPRLTRAAEELYQIPVFIDDTPAVSVTQIRSKARRLKARCPHLGVIVVDYIGLIHGDPRVSREQQVSASSRGLKALAKELQCTVLALSQLNRGVEQREDKRPRLADLRESGAIEQDADVILFIYRDEYYNPETADQGVAEVIVAKQRNGPTGFVKLAFVGEYTRFENLAHGVDSGGYG
jgi:replicative DNA helicase